ncbi:nucleotide-binding protein [Cyclobacterium sp.]|uniref:nucleotide-binding protein n=1 Tax=Cyclobacterium sp. TaxID=1966343 RepID=UPI0019B9D5B1|nr:nucleotide-binding protein [Cyclobacterium sp.]MBD3630983.1 nucleotide-binding protein [Cyclobacterium sp.]
MRPRVFIGSSTEQLSIAYAIQANLDHDAQVTVWTQGVFRLSKSALESLMDSLDLFDFAIFVFHPDDITRIRNSSFETVRDNVVFELGLFLGKLGKDKVFFLVPCNSEGLHLPTDLLGIAPGTFDSNREDGNIAASVGPFCNQVRNHLKEFLYLNIEGIQDQPKNIKDIVIKKEANWEHLLAAELLSLRLADINKAYDELESELLILRLKPISAEDFFQWFKTTNSSLKNFINFFTKCLDELIKSFGPPGEAGKPIEIKNAVERFRLLCEELLSLEYELYGFDPPDELEIIKTKLKGFTKIMFINEINRLHRETREVILAYRKGESIKEFQLTLKPEYPTSMNEVLEIFRAELGYF